MTQPSTEWNYDIKTAPDDGLVIELLVEGCDPFQASWQLGVEDSDGGACGAWMAENEDDHPPCWTDGICWAVNEDSEPSKKPIAWRYFV